MHVVEQEQASESDSPNDDARFDVILVEEGKPFSNRFCACIVDAGYRSPEFKGLRTWTCGSNLVSCWADFICAMLNVGLTVNGLCDVPEFGPRLIVDNSEDK
jgi:hypothetical protein